MISSELLQKIRQIEIRTRHLVDDDFAGEYHSVFKGRGIEFDEVRPYQPGDDIRTIDWNVTARTGDPYVKRYIEERELTVMLAVDASGSGDFGSSTRFKRDLAAELTAVLAFAATTNNDKVGLIIFTDQIELIVPPRKGRKHVLRMVRELLAFQPQQRGTDIKLALDTLNRLLKRRGIIFLVSDFIAEPEQYRRALTVTNRRHDMVAVELCDPLEMQIADVGVIALEDAETGELTWVDTSHRAWRNGFQQHAAETRQNRQRLFKRSGIDQVVIMTDDDYVKPLMGFFHRRAQRLARR